MKVRQKESTQGSKEERKMDKRKVKNKHRHINSIYFITKQSKSV